MLDLITLACLSHHYINANSGTIDELRRSAPAAVDGFIAAAEACHTQDSTRLLRQTGSPDAGRIKQFRRPQQADLTDGANFESIDTGHTPFWEYPPSGRKLSAPGCAAPTSQP